MRDKLAMVKCDAALERQKEGLVDEVAAALTPVLKVSQP